MLVGRRNIETSNLVRRQGIEEHPRLRRHPEFTGEQVLRATRDLEDRAVRCNGGLQDAVDRPIAATDHEDVDLRQGLDEPRRIGIPACRLKFNGVTRVVDSSSEILGGLA